MVLLIDSQKITDAFVEGDHDTANGMLDLAEDHLKNGGSVSYGYDYFDSSDGDKQKTNILLRFNKLDEFIKWRESAFSKF